MFFRLKYNFCNFYNFFIFMGILFVTQNVFCSASLESSVINSCDKLESNCDKLANSCYKHENSVQKPENNCDKSKDSSNKLEKQVIMEVCGIEFATKNRTVAEIFNSIVAGDKQKFDQLLSESLALQKNENALTILMVVAGKYNRIEMVKSLIEAGANVNSDNLGQEHARPILFAVILKNPDFVQVLLEAGADPNVISRMAMMPLIIATVFESDVECLKKLVNAKGVKINSKDVESGMTALMVAALLEKKEMIQVLLDAGADTFMRDRNFSTAADYAKAKGKHDLCDLIEVASKKVDFSDSKFNASGSVAVSSIESDFVTLQEKCGENKLEAVKSEPVNLGNKTSLEKEKKKNKYDWSISKYCTLENLFIAVPVAICACVLVKAIIDRVKAEPKKVL